MKVRIQILEDDGSEIEVATYHNVLNKRLVDIVFKWVHGMMMAHKHKVK